MTRLYAGIIWAAVEYGLMLGVALIIFALLLFYRLRKRNSTMASLAGSGMRGARGTGFWHQCAKLFFALCAVTGIAVALLRPQWGETRELVTQRGRDVLIALDVSRSMLVNDCEPDRLTCAKQKIKQLLSRLSCERVGLVLFAGSAFVQCPLTADFGAFRLFLDQVDEHSISSGSTSLDQAIRVALDLFSDQQERKSKLLVIMTDGEDFSSDLRRYKDAAREQGMHIFTIGLGTPEGAPVPLLDAHGKQMGHQRDARGSVVISRLNEGILSALSHDVGGNYLRVTQDASDVDRLVKRLASFEKEELGREAQVHREERYHWFLLASFIACAIEWLL